MSASAGDSRSEDKLQGRSEGSVIEGSRYNGNEPRDLLFLGGLVPNVLCAVAFGITTYLIGCWKRAARSALRP